jgi:uncharacterized protein (TIGR03435 family)
MMKRILAAAAALALQAQQPVAYETASVKVNNSGSTSMNMHTDPSQIEWGNIPLRNLVELAYGVKDHSLVAPAWLDDARYDVRAKIADGVKLSQNSEMLQALLVERFKLAVHHEERVMTVYELVAGKDESKLKLHPSTEPKKRSLKTGREGRHLIDVLDMKSLAATLSNWLDHPLIDKTGITGNFDIDLQWSTSESDPDHPTILSELRDKLGLDVKSGKAPVEILVVDHAEKIPTEN